MNVRRRLVSLAGAAALVGVGLVSAPGEAVVTRNFSLDTSAELSAGVLDRVAVTADGQVVLGAEVRRIAPPRERRERVDDSRPRRRYCARGHRR